MVIKKFVAESMSEALVQIRQELGEDAVILQSRKIEKGGLLNFLNKQMVEVTAATPDTHPLPQKPLIQLDPVQREELALATGRKRITPSEGGESVRGPVNRPAPTSLEDSAQRRASSSNSTGKEMTELKQFRSEITELRHSVAELAEHMKYKSAPSLPSLLSRKWHEMVDNGVDEKKAHDMTQTLFAQIRGEDLENDELITHGLKDLIVGKLRTGAIMPKTRDKPLVLAVIGPTGVGKTTTLAKMATNKRMFGKMKAALISTDTYRIAAVEQLQTFASIAGLPMEVVYRPEELSKAIKKHSDKDVVLIDTAGRSQNDSNSLLELREFMEAAAPDEIVLVLSAGTRLRDQKDIIHRFGQIQITRLVLSKLDEVSSVGHLLDIADITPRKWSHITTGQNVPDDIIEAMPVQLAPWIMSKELFEGARRNHFKNDY
ncbi:flagellar biosynthesis protein FlhF [Calditrichota bacterium]